ncbi:hypothetical protein OCT63_18870 [Vibrio sp. RW]|uniref:hypothetical protein n=1 Tax=Vibrio sp. RW TaxID=2998833 RepID=UPI0022CD7C83|nr:hypothetical protein [Vibrio sp. RW]MDA0146290.1 hypothetical protein [Vibrio sp. RW]
MKLYNQIGKTLFALMISVYAAPILANNGTRAQQGGENIDAIASSWGSALYTLVMAAGIAMTGWSIWTWYKQGQDNQGNANKGEMAKMLKGAIGGCALSFPTAWMLFFGEAAGVVEATQQAVDYRNLVGQAAQ